ncbi:hypothetical protein RB600_003726 [Gaeumannomyces tritici]
MSRLFEAMPREDYVPLSPVSREAKQAAEVLGVPARKPKASRPKGDPGPRLAQADPVTWWEANKPNSCKHVAWGTVARWERRGQLHTYLAEGTGHGNFEAYHKRFNHPPSDHWWCVCGGGGGGGGGVKEVGHTAACELRRVPAPWEKDPRGPDTEEAAWQRRGHNAVVRTNVERTLKALGLERVLHVGKEGIEGRGPAPRGEAPADPDTDEEEELPVAEPGRLE